MSALKLPTIFTDHMILQRDIPLTIWGWAGAGEKISVALAGQTASAVADGEGKWKTRLAALPAGGPHELAVSTGSETIRRGDVLVGDVWICSGQSNMEWPLSASHDALAEIAAASHRQIRLLHLPRATSHQPAGDIDAAWNVCDPQSVPEFSAVAYFFGREIQRQVGVPIGLIGTSWGGTPAEAWTPVQSPKAHPALAHLGENLSESDVKKPDEPHVDSGNKGQAMGWAGVNFDDSNWAVMDLPRTWHSTGLNIDGSVWFRRTVDLPAGFAGKPLMLNLGAANDFDAAYFNGKHVGGLGKETPAWWMTPRHYRIDASLVKAGRNMLAVRVFNQWAEGGLVGPADAMTLHPEDNPSAAINLAGDWKYQVEEALPHRQPASAVLPTTLFNAMVAPLTQFAIRGAIWYQGESNASRAAQYRTLFPTMIRAWRREWGQGDFPFLFVQLANFTAKMDNPAGSPWAELREAQSGTLMLPNTGQAVIIDIGEMTDIHPRNKKDVGLRLANEAMVLSYGQAAPRSPLMESVQFKDGAAIATFKHADDGLRARDGEPRGFALAGEDQKFHPAAATIHGSMVKVSTPAVKSPVAVRYGWAECPDCNLINRAGLPASPFRSDDWPAVTMHAK